MAFINPSVISNISREEFEELKQRVDKIDSELHNSNVSINPSNVIDNSMNQTVEETIMNSSQEFNMDEYTIKDINIQNAVLSGIPRIEFFNFNKKVEDNNNNIINLSDVLNNTEEKEFTYRLDNIPVKAKTSSGHRTALIDENKVNKLKNAYYGDVKKFAA